ncbi:MAG: hypothetical protein ACSLFK_03685 [Gemmatimonadaceae bacterium]
MFFVSDRKDMKERRIKETLRREPMIAVLLAAANVEWTIGRTILMLGQSPNVDVRDRLNATYGLKKYKELWKHERQLHDRHFPGLATVINEWDKFSTAFELRHKLIHGRGTCGRSMAADPVSRMLRAVVDLYSFAESRGVDLNARPKIRRRKR